MITMAEMCRRLETEEEKVLPFYASSLTEEEQQDVEAAIQEQPYEKLSLVGTRKTLIGRYSENSHW